MNTNRSEVLDSFERQIGRTIDWGSVTFSKTRKASASLNSEAASYELRFEGELSSVRNIAQEMLGDVADSIPNDSRVCVFRRAENLTLMPIPAPVMAGVGAVRECAWRGSRSVAAGATLVAYVDSQAPGRSNSIVTLQ